MLFDFARWRDGLLATVSDELTHALDVAGTQLFEELGRDDVWTMPDPRAVKFLDQRKNFIRDAADSFHAELKGIMQDAIAQGKGQPETIRDITTRFADVDQATAKVWASTEIAAAYGEARQQGLIEAGIAFKRWVCSFDNSRATHIAAHEDERNQRVPVGESFHVGKDLLVFPGDSEHGSPEEVINCHCLAIAVSEHEDPNGGSGDGLTKYEREGLFP